MKWIYLFDSEDDWGYSAHPVRCEGDEIFFREKRLAEKDF